MLAWLQGNARAEKRGGELSPPPPGSIICKTRIARTLNALCGCTTFTAWNIDDVPDIDMYEITKYIKWKAAIERKNGG